MREWIRPLIWLLLMVAVRRAQRDCDEVIYRNICWNTSTRTADNGCWLCEMLNSYMSSPETKQLAGNIYYHLEMVEIYGSGVARLPELTQLFQNSKHVIQQVILIQTYTSVLNAEFFGNNCRNLKYFMSDNIYLLSVEGSAFKNCTSLENLSFNAYSIRSIPFDAFFALHRLIRLEIRDGSLTVWHPEWFQDLMNLEELDLRHNQLQEIPEEAFVRLTKLKKLNLMRNEVKTITKKMFELNSQLEVLNLEHNWIKNIQVGSFQNLQKIVKLYLWQNICTNNTFLHKTSTDIAEGLTSCYPTACIIPVIPNGFVIRTEDNSTQTPGGL